MTKSDCLREFIKAATDARQEKYGRAKALVEAVRKEEGDMEANAMRAEIWRFAQMDQEYFDKTIAEISTGD